MVVTRIFAVTLASTLLTASCTSTSLQKSTEPDNEAPTYVSANLDATAWVQTSSEYMSIALGTYAAAAESLDAQFQCRSGKTAPKNSAVVLDIDETVLDNSPYQAWLIIESQKEGEPVGLTPSTWRAWMKLAEARAVPGAVDFVQFAQACGLNVFYITNRQCTSIDRCQEEAWTIRNLENVGLRSTPVTRILMKNEKPEWASSGKQARRRYLLEQGFNIVMLIGDDSNDMMDGVYKESIAHRQHMVTTNSSKWGKAWFVLPGPTYGSWKKPETLSVPVEENLILPSKDLTATD